VSFDIVPRTAVRRWVLRLSKVPIFTTTMLKMTPTVQAQISRDVEINE